MDVKVQSSTTIAQGSTESTPMELPLGVFDLFAPNFHTGYLLAFGPLTPTNFEIIQAFSATLLHFPLLVGHLNDTHAPRPCITLCGPGCAVLVVEATVATKLDDHLPLQPSPSLWQLHPPLGEPRHLLQVQLNRFACGGLVIGCTVHHRVADGHSMGLFFAAWGKALRGIATDPLPVYNRSFLRPREPPKCEFQHRGFEFLPIPEDHVGFPESAINADPEKITNILLHYSPDFITKLKASLPTKYSTFETLLTHLWKKISVARNLYRDQYTLLSVAINGRRRLNPPAPSEYFGNLVLAAYPRAKVKDLLNEDMAGTARRVREAVNEIGDSYFRSFIDFGEIHKEEELVPVFEVFGNVLAPNLEVDSWLGLGFEEINFGGGAMRAFLPTWIPADGLVIFVPAMEEEGGVDVVVTLLEEHARELRKISHSLY